MLAVGKINIVMKGRLELAVLWTKGTCWNGQGYQIKGEMTGTVTTLYKYLYIYMDSRK
jgi:hypothetical protein